MVAYTLPECPDLIISIRGKDSEKSRKQAMEQLHQMMENDEIPADSFPNGVSFSDFIEVDSSKLTPGKNGDDNNEVLQAVQTLSNLALLKIDLEKDRQPALEIYEMINGLLFSDSTIDEAEIDRLKQGFKTLKLFAQNYVKLQSALPQAEVARDLLNQALYGETGSEADRADAKTAVKAGKHE